MKIYEKSVFRVFRTAIIVNPLKPWSRTLSQSIGTCVVVNIKDVNYYLTNYHVVADAKIIEVDNIQEKVLYHSLILDIAILSCSKKDVIALAFGEAKTSDAITLLGFPTTVRGLSIFKGTINRIVKHVWEWGKSLFFQIDANSNPGNSGGPIINGDGELCGILIGANLAYNSMYFAIPYFTIGYVVKLFASGEAIHYSVPNFSWQTTDEYMPYKEKVLVNQKYLVSSIEGIEILDEGQIRIGDFLKKLDYNAIGNELISFQYLIPYLNKKSVKMGKYEFPLSVVSFENYEKSEYILFGDFVFVPFTQSAYYSYFTDVLLDNVYVYIAYAIKSKYRKKILNITWNEFAKKIKKFEGVWKIPFYNDTWILFLNSKDKKKENCKFLFTE